MVKKAETALIAVLILLAGCSALLDPGRGSAKDEIIGEGTSSENLRARMVGTWVRHIRGQQGAIEGMRFDEDGIFGFIGIHTMNGLAWRIENETLILSTNSTRYAQPSESSLKVVMLTDRTLTLAGKDYLSGEYRRNDAAGARVTGTVTCRELGALPEDAFIYLSLLEVSFQDAPAGFVADQNIPSPGRQMPIPFHIYYATADVDPLHTYQVRADVVLAGKREFTTAMAYPVITRGNPSTVAVEVVRLAGHAGAEGVISEGDTVSEPAPAAAGDRVLLSGMFSYLADAALFVECRTSRRFPVAMERDYLALERAYLGTEHEPGQEIFVTVEGHFANRQKMEGEGREEMLIVERFINIVPGEDCKTVETATSYRIQGEILELLRDSTVFARFESENRR